MQDEIMGIAESLFPFDYSIAGNGNDLAITELMKLLDFKIYSYPTGSRLNGWEIPRAWRLNRFQLFADGNLILDDADHPFLVAKNSPSVDVELNYQELVSKTNISLTGKNNDYVYDWRNLYSGFKEEWAISLSKEILDELKKYSRFRVCITSEFYDSKMHVLVFDTHPDADRSIIVNAHNCHPFQANDDVSGIVAGVLTAKEWQKRIDENLNVRLIIAPELYGPIFFLDDQYLNRNELCAILFKAIGNDSGLKLQNSLNIEDTINQIIVKVCSEKEVDISTHPFRTLYGNDEIVFENPPFRIPTVTFTRIPFLEYHSSSDNLGILNPNSIFEVVSITLASIEVLSKNLSFVWKATGLPKLSFPGSKVYRPTPAHGVHRLGSSEIEKRWHILMNSLPGLISQGTTVLELSKQFDLPFFEVYDYLVEWEKLQFIVRSTDKNLSR